MNKIIGTLIFLANCFSLSFCSKNTDNNETEKQNNSHTDVFYYGSIPSQFWCFNKKYIYEIRSSSLNLDEKIGWLINEIDLQKWQAVDENNELVYAVDINNSVTRNDPYENLKNRYELFSYPNDTSRLVIKDDGGWSLIYKMEGNE